MNPEIKAQWIADLLSGEYQQGKDKLKVVNDLGVRHCCLGVLCEQAVKAGVIEETSGGGWSPRTFTALANRGDYSSTELPDAVVVWAGLHQSNPVFRDAVGNGSVLSLTQLNDVLAKSFAEIAALIEEHL